MKPIRGRPLAGIAGMAGMAGILVLSGCTISTVDVTDRGNLAREVMQRDFSAELRAGELHAYTSKENTAGGYAIGGGGCGCN